MVCVDSDEAVVGSDIDVSCGGVNIVSSWIGETRGLPVPAGGLNLDVISLRAMSRARRSRYWLSCRSASGLSSSNNDLRSESTCPSSGRGLPPADTELSRRVSSASPNDSSVEATEDPDVMYSPPWSSTATDLFGRLCCRGSGSVNESESVSVGGRCVIGELGIRVLASPSSPVLDFFPDSIVVEDAYFS